MRVLSVVCIVIVALSLGSSPVEAGYTFTKIADSNGTLHQFTAASINNGGTVAFFASEGNMQGIFKGRGEEITTVVDETFGFNSFGNPAINNSGTVVFPARTQEIATTTSILGTAVP